MGNFIFATAFLINDYFQDSSRNEVEAVKASIPRYKLAPRSVTQYAWDQPAAREKKLMLILNDARSEEHTSELQSQ